MRRLSGGKAALACMIVGAALALGAAVLLLAGNASRQQARQDAAQVLEQAQRLMPQGVDRVPAERGNNTMAAMEVEGVNVIGVLSFPAYGCTLPVHGEWDTTLVEAMPCRFLGSIYDGSLIIGAVDHRSQLPFASAMEVGDRVVLTDMEGGRYPYRVSAIQHAKRATRSKLESDADMLTIFVKDSKTSQYLILRCEVDF